MEVGLGRAVAEVGGHRPGVDPGLGGGGQRDGAGRGEGGHHDLALDEHEEAVGRVALPYDQLARLRLADLAERGQPVEPVLLQSLEEEQPAEHALVDHAFSR
nr:hypothetical protein GCM10020093_101990 [Planobispora longispora]